MDKKALLEQFTKWNIDGESEKVIAAVISLPNEVLDADIMYALADSYLKTENPKKAVAVLEGIRKTEENTYKWQYMMGHALLITLREDDECSEDEELRIAVLERIRSCFSKGMTMNPPEPYIIEAKNVLRFVEKQLNTDDEDEYGDMGDMGDFDGSDDEDESGDSEYDGIDPLRNDGIEVYDEADDEALQEHIEEYFGEFPTVFHEIASQDIHVDVAVIPPSEERNYYTLITMGMGAHKMTLSDGVDEDYARAELLICLPPDWKVGERDNIWYWPTGLIKSLAHLPIDCDTWLGWAHTVDNNGNPYADNTDFCGVVLIDPQDVEEGADQCVLPSGDVVNFYQVIPIYSEEMEYKLNNDADDFLEKLLEVASHVVDIDRPNAFEDYFYTNFRYDVVERHSSKVRRNHFPLDPICGCNHIAIFVRWCIEHYLIEPGFYEHCPDIANDVFNGKDVDLRRFVIEVMGGRIELYRFTYLGANFINNYYCNDDRGKFSYFSDVDDYAESYFGTEKYNSEEFKDEAYLFVPFDEQYYQGMSKYIQRAYDDYFEYFSNVKKNENDKILGILSELFEFEPQSVMPDSDLFNELKSNYPERNDGKSSVPMIVCQHELCTSTEKAQNALRDALMPFLNIYSLITVPYYDPMRWVEKFFFETSDRLQIPETYEKIFEMYGQYPWLLTYDREDAKRFTLFIQDYDGSIVRYDLKDEYIED